jgi:hypothetical protein
METVLCFSVREFQIISMPKIPMMRLLGKPFPKPLGSLIGKKLCLAPLAEQIKFHLRFRALETFSFVIED